MTQVSIIASCYKARRFLDSFLQSTRQQSHKDLELVLHTNEPSIYERSLIKSFSQSDLRLTHITDTPVIPLYTAWNKCIRHSTGEYIAIGNADDLRTEKSVQVMAQALDNDSSLDFVYGNFMTVSKFPSTKGHLVDVVDQQESLKRGMILGPFFMFRKIILEKTGLFDEQFKSGGDYDFAMRLARVGKGICLSENLGYYLDEGKGLSTGSLLQPVERTAIELRYNLDILERKMVPKALGYELEEMFWEGEKHSVGAFFKRNSLSRVHSKDFLELVEKQSTFSARVKEKVKGLFRF